MKLSKSPPTYLINQIPLTSAVLHDDSVVFFALLFDGEGVDVLDDLLTVVVFHPLSLILLDLGVLGVGVDLEHKSLLVWNSLNDVSYALRALPNFFFFNSHILSGNAVDLLLLSLYLGGLGRLDALALLIGRLFIIIFKFKDLSITFHILVLVTRLSTLLLLGMLATYNPVIRVLKEISSVFPHFMRGYAL